MTGLQKICKLYGSIKINNEVWVWDYNKDKPVLKSEMTKEEFKDSERKRWMGK